MPPLRIETHTPPPAEPLSLAEAKAHLRIEAGTTEEDALVEALIRSAREACESFTGRALVERSLTLRLDAWPTAGEGPIEEGWREGALIEGPPRALVLPRPPLRAVTHVKLYDDADGETTWPLASYLVDTASEPGRLVARTGVTWPRPGRAANGIEVRYRAGYAPDESASPTDYAANIPQALRDGMKRLLAQLYERRGDEPATALAGSGAALLWQPYRVLRL